MIHAEFPDHHAAVVVIADVGGFLFDGGDAVEVVGCAGGVDVGIEIGGGVDAVEGVVVGDDGGVGFGDGVGPCGAGAAVEGDPHDEFVFGHAVVEPVGEAADGVGVGGVIGGGEVVAHDVEPIHVGVDGGGGDFVGPGIDRGGDEHVLGMGDGVEVGDERAVGGVVVGGGGFPVDVDAVEIVRQGIGDDVVGERGAGGGAGGEGGEGDRADGDRDGDAGGVKGGDGGIKVGGDDAAGREGAVVVGGDREVVGVGKGGQVHFGEGGVAVFGEIADDAVVRGGGDGVEADVVNAEGGGKGCVGGGAEDDADGLADEGAIEGEGFLNVGRRSVEVGEGGEGLEESGAGRVHDVDGHGVVCCGRGSFAGGDFGPE